MTLNFLKRKRTFRPSILLHHNLQHKQMEPSPSDSPAATGRRHLWDDIPKRPKQTSQFATDQTDENTQRQKAMDHIEKLVSEISVSQRSDNSGRLQTVTINQMLDNITFGPLRDKYSGLPLQKKTAVTKASHKGPKTSLDIEELQTVAAMAKRLSAGRI